MDFSDLSQAARDRIAAAEIEAEMILKRSTGSRRVGSHSTGNPVG